MVVIHFCFRVSKSIEAGNDHLILPSVDGGKWCASTSACNSSAAAPDSEQQPFPSVCLPPYFNYGRIVEFLGINEDGYTDKPLKRGREYVDTTNWVNLVSDGTHSQLYDLRGNVKASMNKKVHKVRIVISHSTGKVEDGECDSVASEDKRCSHIAAVLLTLERHIQLKGLNPRYKPAMCLGSREHGPEPKELD